ncbi:acyltransferase [Vagococcus hydrophili]|uniref:Acyltransferase n=1 Tax=Vagococcus hydrophili TaxID=2714947 RepID=A0A6G8AR68_9ENTE|nr:acyltransferase [Vagococcus hydrophili]QIL47423.1 acyltransferase [Vagococcus hydrophili]
MIMIDKINFFFSRNGFTRGKILKKKKYLKFCGDNVFFQPRKIPSDAKLVSLGNNVVIASQVVFINHDVMHHVFNNIEKHSTSYHMGKIEIGDNVFIGANTILFPNIKISDNVIIAAGSHVYKDINQSGVYAGIPLKKIKEFEKVFEVRKKEHSMNKDLSREEIIKQIWKS